MSTLTTYAEMVQGSAEWLEARRGLLTASTIGQLISPKTLAVAGNETARMLTYQLVAERATGHVEDTYQSHDMIVGTLEEPRARTWYSRVRTSPVAEIGFMVREWDGIRLGYSPDSLVGSDGLIEIKTRVPKHQVQVLNAQAVPAAHMAQLQAGLYVSGRDWIDYISWCGGLPPFVQRVEPDPDWEAAIITAAEAFEYAAQRMTAIITAAAGRTDVPERIDYDQEITF